jgi:hypothetical protein
MEYELYHDESQVDGYWHGILLVPVPAKQGLLRQLAHVRESTGYDRPLSFKHVRGPGAIWDCADGWIQVGVSALRSRGKGEAYHIFAGRRGARNRKCYEPAQDLIAAKFILFCERDGLAQVQAHPDYASKVETTFRMGLKGGMHYLGCDEEPIEIVRLHFDGFEHLRRHVDGNRMVGRMSGLRAYCSISADADIIDDHSGNHMKPESQPYEDCQLLQLADVLIGAFRVAIQPSGNPLRSELAKPVQLVISRYRQGFARMRNSRWFRSFWLSECYLESGSWHYDTLEWRSRRGVVQMPLLLE